MPTASFAFESLATRLRHDLRTSFPAIDVRVWQSEDGVLCEVLDGEASWGEIGFSFWGDEDVEWFVARAVTTVTDNLWPDELVDPWPLCPTHGDHPLSPALVRGRASWRCSHDDRTVVAIGDLSE